MNFLHSYSCHGCKCKCSGSEHTLLAWQTTTVYWVPFHISHWCCHLVSYQVIMTCWLSYVMSIPFQYYGDWLWLNRINQNKTAPLQNLSSFFMSFRCHLLTPGERAFSWRIFSRHHVWWLVCHLLPPMANASIGFVDLHFCAYVRVYVPVWFAYMCYFYLWFLCSYVCVCVPLYVLSLRF